MPFARSSKSRKPPAPLDIEGLLAYSARVLTARAQTTSELRQKLTRRAAQPGDVDEVIRRLKENGYLNDQRFAESFANWRRDNDGVGKTKVVRDSMAAPRRPGAGQKDDRSRIFGYRRGRADRTVPRAQISRQRSGGAASGRKTSCVRIPPSADRRLQRGPLHQSSEALRLRSRTPGRNRRRRAAGLGDPRPTEDGQRTSGSDAARRANLRSRRCRFYPIPTRVFDAHWRTPRPAA